jgi:foldase protein PrsA
MKLRLSKVKRNIILIFVVLCIISGVVVAGYANRNTEKNIVASVNGEQITKDELYDQLIKLSGQQGINALVSQKIIELEAKKQKITVSKADIDKEMKKYYEYYGGKEAFNKALSKSAYSEADVTNEMEMSLKIRKLLEPRISITEKDIKTYFEENKEIFNQKEQVKASHILVENEKTANQVLKKLADGEDFAKLAKEFSTDTVTKEDGGELGFITSGQMDEEFEKAAFALAVGELSGAVKTNYGYHIIKVEDKKDAKEAKLEENKDKIEEILFEKKVEAEYESWLHEVSPQYEIKNYLVQS